MSYQFLAVGAIVTRSLCSCPGLTDLSPFCFSFIQKSINQPVSHPVFWDVPVQLRSCPASPAIWPWSFNLWLYTVSESSSVSWTGPTTLPVAAWKQELPNTPEGRGGEEVISLSFSTSAFSSTAAVGWWMGQGGESSGRDLHGSARTLCLRKWFHDLFSDSTLNPELHEEEDFPRCSPTSWTFMGICRVLGSDALYKALGRQYRKLSLFHNALVSCLFPPSLFF